MHLLINPKIFESFLQNMGGGWGLGGRCSHLGWSDVARELALVAELAEGHVFLLCL